VIARQVQAALNQMDQTMNQLYNLGNRIKYSLKHQISATNDRVWTDINTGSKLLDRQNGPNPKNLAAKALNCFLTTTLALQDFLIDY